MERACLQAGNCLSSCFPLAAATLPSLTPHKWKNLASYGYLVWASCIPTKQLFRLFLDGRVVTPANDYWSRLSTGNPENFEQVVSDMLAQDIRFVIDKLIDANKDSTSIF
jgi:hypothetical protein